MFELTIRFTVERFKEVEEWCRTHLWPRPGLRWQVVAMTPIYDSRESSFVFSFSMEQDYVYFYMTWCHEPVNVV